MQRGDIWFAVTPGGDRPVLVLTRRSGRRSNRLRRRASLTRTCRGLVSELELSAHADGVPSDCVVNFDNVHTLPRGAFRRWVSSLSPARLAEVCRVLAAATGC